VRDERQARFAAGIQLQKQTRDGAIDSDNVEFWLLRDVVKRWDILVKVFVNLSAWRRGVVQELIRA
jgi:hypothetical protein